MLNKYREYLDLDIIKEVKSHPDPPDMKSVYRTMSFHGELSRLIDEEVRNAKKYAMEKAIKVLEEKLKGMVICINDENGRQKILEVNGVELGHKSGDYYPVLVEDSSKKVRYNWENSGRSQIFDIAKFLTYFEKHFNDRFLAMQAKSINGGDIQRYVKHVISIGVYTGDTQDYVMVNNDDGTSLFLMHSQPIKILDMELKQLDPYGEENWEN